MELQSPEVSSKNGESYPTGRTVPFPYDNPYPQQVELMDALLSSLKTGGKVFLLESPTGTGKSISLACSAMAWLRHEEKADLEAAEKEKEASPLSSACWLEDWVTPEEREQQHELAAVRQRARSTRDALTKELSVINGRVSSGNRERRENLVRSAVTAAKMRERNGRLKKVRRRKTSKIAKEVDYCIADYMSDSENDCNEWDSSDEESARMDNEGVSHLLDGACLDGSSTNHGKTALGGVIPGSGVRKIIYAARTHSQLSQFVGELKRSVKDVRVVALGSRKVLCGNKTEVNRPGRSEQAINDACLDLQKNKSSACPLLSSKEGLATLALHGLAQPSDIEDAAALGEASHSCAYYASRSSLAAAEVIVLPYSMLLSPSSRKSVGLSLKESLVIVDEAHNLPEAIRALQSCRLSLPVVEASLEQLSAYTQRYINRLAGRNLYYLGQLRTCIKSFIRYLKQEPRASRMISAGELLVEVKLDNINLFKIISYLERSRLPQKLLGFTNSNGSDDKENDIGISRHVSSLSLVQTFLCRLNCRAEEGKFVTNWPKVHSYERPGNDKYPTLRFVALHPAAHFENVVSEARAVALVGGTLQPFGHVAAELLDNTFLTDAAKADAFIQSSSDSKEISLTYKSKNFAAFTCDHVVPSRNVLLERLSTGPSSTVDLDFRHKSRSTDAVIDELGRTLQHISTRVPAGIVVFLPSFSYEAQIIRRWKTCGIWNALNRNKRVHREPRRSTDVETTLEAYAKDAKTCGALLLSVVGGKMSEGINFANDMARCVVVVGLPYPDITDVELKEKMMTMDKSAGGMSGQAYYQNLCLRAVNQSVGRAIRHANDYAAIVLIDQRYRNDARIWQGLPKWLRRSDKKSEDSSFSKSMAQIELFFAKQRE